MSGVSFVRVSSAHRRLSPIFDLVTVYFISHKVNLDYYWNPEAEQYTRPNNGNIPLLSAAGINPSIVDSSVMAGSRSICTEAGHELKIETSL